MAACSREGTNDKGKRKEKDNILVATDEQPEDEITALANALATGTLEYNYTNFVKEAINNFDKYNFDKSQIREQLPQFRKQLDTFVTDEGIIIIDLVTQPFGQRSLLSIFQILQQFCDLFPRTYGPVEVKFELRNLWTNFPAPVISLKHQKQEGQMYFKHWKTGRTNYPSCSLRYDEITNVLDKVVEQNELTKFLLESITTDIFPIDARKHVAALDHIYYLLWLLFCVEPAPGRIAKLDIWIIAILSLFVQEDKREFNETYTKCLHIVKDYCPNGKYFGTYKVKDVKFCENPTKLMDVCGDKSAVFTSGQILQLGRDKAADMVWKKVRQELYAKFVNGQISSAK